ncbi:type I restriction endonuclease subunit R [Kordia sp.]|uniref:type I restriction endonuclease subunit R n=1 Tax=Kordia sp. TaxID=1965332 RepID=UPI003D278F63
MKTPSFQEDHISQVPALQLLIAMGYTYVTPNEAKLWRGNKSSQVLFEDVLRKQLQKLNSIQRKGNTYDFSEGNINAAITALKDLPMHNGFMSANNAFYNLITLGKAFEQTIDGDKKSHTIQYVDWEHPQNNSYHVTEEFSVLRTGSSKEYRPDIVLFINGIPMVVIECKSPALSGTKSPTELASEQHIRNFSKDGIRGLYVYSNLLLSIATNEGSYATTGTSLEFWSKWKEQYTSAKAEENDAKLVQQLKNKPLTALEKEALFSDRFKYVKSYFDALEKEERLVTAQDQLLHSLCNPKRLLDIMHNFVLYDNGIKKIARYQQYFTVNRILNRVATITSEGKRKGGVVWHTQGSGKSLTMVMLAQLLATPKNILNPKIILVTDRIDLDDQISETFRKCKREVRQARTGTHLTELLQDSSDAIITTIINKFEAAVKQCKTPFTSPDIFVLIDEGHRTQYGTFNVNMERIFPNACFLAFTGTPLMKKEKSTANKFGGYIGTPYTVRDAVNDGAVVPLLYEGRHNLITVDEKPLNRYFDRIATKLSEEGKASLKRKFNTVNELNKAPLVIQERALDISEHYTQFFQTSNDIYKPKAQLVAPSIKTALLYHECLNDIGMVSSAVVVSQSDQREGTTDGFYNVNEDKRREDEYFNAMIDKYGDIKSYEKSIINDFKHREHPEILIVVAKLLTGFDAPNNTVLYLCRSLTEHTLLQAIARVNRVAPGKDYGYIIDYYGNLEHLDTALEVYSNSLGFEEEDIVGMATNMEEEAKKLPQAHSELWDIFKTLRNKTLEPSAYEELLQPKDIRDKFYTKLSNFARLLKMALSSVHYVNNTSENKIKGYKKDAKFFLKLRMDVKRRFGDDLDYKEYEPKIQKLINQHISTEGEVVNITDLIDVFSKEGRDAALEKLHGDAAKADYITSQIDKSISVRMDEDPIFYKKLSELIKETIAAYYQKRISEAEYLKRAKEFEEEFNNGRKNSIPEALEGNESAAIFYDFSNKIFEDIALLKVPFHEEVGLAVDAIIQEHMQIDGKKIVEWYKNEDVKGKMNIAIGDAVYDILEKYETAPDWKLIETLIANCMKVAESRYK